MSGVSPPPFSPASPSASPQTPRAKVAISDQAVLEYLKSKGMGSALLELQDKLKKEIAAKTNTPADPNNPKAVDQQEMTKLKEKLDHDDDVLRNQRTALHKSTGGGFGYDRDAAAPIVQWGIPNNTLPDDSPQKKTKKNLVAHLGEKEAQAYLDSFTALQLWVLTLPDDPQSGSNLQPKTHDPIAKAQELIAMNKDKKISLSSMLKEMNKPIAVSSKTKDTELATFQLPPSAKPELIAVTFALLVHTYCELLEVGMETTAHVLRDTFGPSIYEPIYGEELKDLYHVTTTEDMVKLNAHNSQHMEALAQLKQILVRIAEYQLKQEEIKNASLPSNAQQDVAKQAAAEKARETEIERYQKAIDSLEKRHKDFSQRASNAFDRMYDLPFLRRARAVRWQLTLSSASYGLLVGFLSNTSANQSLLAMSTLLQTKCEVHVEQRDPLPITPAVLMDDGDDDEKDLAKTALCNWAAPSRTGLKTKKNRPFPKFHLEEEYENEASAKRDKKMVEFNRSMLVYGFRRLEALERKREFQTMKNSRTAPTVVTNPLEPSILLSTLCANNISSSSEMDSPSSPVKKISPSSATSPSATASFGARKTSTTASANSTGKNIMTAAMWEEAGIGLTCAKLCPPDGRRIAVGCDDSAVRIWDLMDLQKDGTAGDAAQVLLGHKNGFPVFDVSWNRDGRSLLSAGGDGTIRLWDTMLQGPYGEVAESISSSTVGPPKKTGEKAVTNAIAKESLDNATSILEQAKLNPDMNVPGLRPESNVVASSGAALAVYRHAAQKPIWSTAFAPCGYYFASAGADGTARLWTTDRVVPVRIFCGHTSSSVNSVVFHPNCNYILTGSDDKTARLWDIQTGKCVRLLTGCPSGIYQVQIDPSGQYAVGADAAGSVHMWDLGTSKKISEFRPPAGMKGTSKKSNSQFHKNMAMCHSLAFSTCGTALASGGDDRCVRIWDVRKAVHEQQAVVDIPFKSMPTRRTMLMDLHYTKRNLLLSVGKYINQ
jgi:WD40 repeat protein